VIYHCQTAFNRGRPLAKQSKKPLGSREMLGGRATHDAYARCRFLLDERDPAEIQILREKGPHLAFGDRRHVKTGQAARCRHAVDIMAGGPKVLDDALVEALARQ
jgi:hypothetical protein